MMAILCVIGFAVAGTDAADASPISVLPSLMPVTIDRGLMPLAAPLRLASDDLMPIRRAVKAVAKVVAKPLVKPKPAPTPVAGPTVRVIEWYADWCAPCRQYEPTIKQLIDEGWPIERHDTDKEGEYSRSLGVTSIPAMQVIEVTGSTARAIESLTGVQPRARVLELLRRHKIQQRGPAFPLRPSPAK